MTAEQFVDKWRGTQLTEKAASHEHFIDLCHVLGEPTPAEADPTGQDYCFEKSVAVVGAASKGSKGAAGFVDVWKRGCFAWEYKRQGHHKDLSDAYRPAEARALIRHSAIMAAYGATVPAGHWAEVFTETGAGQPLAANHVLAGRRGEVERRVLESFLEVEWGESGKDRLTEGLYIAKLP